MVGGWLYVRGYAYTPPSTTGVIGTRCTRRTSTTQQTREESAKREGPHQRGADLSHVTASSRSRPCAWPRRWPRPLCDRSCDPRSGPSPRTSSRRQSSSPSYMRIRWLSPPSSSRAESRVSSGAGSHESARCAPRASRRADTRRSPCARSRRVRSRRSAEPQR